MHSKARPLICPESHQDEAVMLLEAILNRLNSYEVFVCIPRKETALLKVLENAGLKEDFRVERMFLGSAVTKNCICAAESLERG